jgi:hypothetical protein
MKSTPFMRSWKAEKKNTEKEIAAGFGILAARGID